MTRLRIPALALIVAGICVAGAAWSTPRTQPASQSTTQTELQPVSLTPAQQIVYGSDGSTSLPDGVKIATTDGVITTVATTEGTPEAGGWNDVLGTRYTPGSVDGTDVTRQLWRSVKLRITKSDGSIASVVLARPLWWFKANNAHEVGDKVDLVLHELGIEGKATVQGIGPVDADSREGSSGSSIVTATIKHENATVLNLVFNDLAEEPLGVTANHPIYSQERDDWVPAGDLRIGEKVVAKDGFATLTSRSEVPGRHTVYNLEVHRVHTFHVSDLGILVHNTCPDNKVYQLVDDEGVPVYYGIADGDANLAARLRDHANTKAGKFKGQQVIADGLTRDQAKSLETGLIDTAKRSGRDILNKVRSTRNPTSPLPDVTDPTVTHLPK